MIDVIGSIFVVILFVIMITMIVTMFGWLCVEAVRTASRDWNDWRQRKADR